ncbi:MAG: C39 family peptidase [Caldilineaceae bacterium]
MTVPYFPQQADGYCLPACAQMTLAHLGISRSQTVLGRQLGLIKDGGVPYSNVTRLASSELTVVFTTGALEDIEQWLVQGLPVIVFVQAGELPYHRGKWFQHAVLITGLDEQDVYILDPDVNIVPVKASVLDFQLAWDVMDNQFAVILRRK